MTDDTLVHFAGEVKMLEEEDDRMKVGGYVVLFGDPSTADLSSTKDYFTKSTDFGLDVATKGRVRWHHGLDPAMGRKTLGLVDFKAEPDDVGQWADGWISKRTDYEKKVAEWVKAKKAGWSTGVAAHCVGRKAMGEGVHEITEWCLGSDCSITLTPADPRQIGGVLSLKSLFGDGPGSQSSVADATPPSIVDRSGRLVADAAELKALFAKALDQRHAEGRGLSTAKWEALKKVSDELADLCRKAEPRVDPRIVAELHNQFLLMDSDAAV